MRAFLAVLRKDLLRRLRSPLAPVVLLLFPVVFSLLIGVTFGRGGERLAPIEIALVDEDNGILGRLVQTALSQSQGQGPARLDVKVASLEEANGLIESNEVSAILRIPPGFTDSLLAERPATLELIKNPAQGIYPEIAQQYVEVLAQLGGAAVRVLGGPAREIRESLTAGRPPGDDFVARVATTINHKLRGVGRYAFPPAVYLVSPEPEGGGRNDASPLRVAVYVLPGMAIYALLMLAIVSLQDFQRERVRGTMARQFVAPVPFAAVILGKLASTWILSLVSILILALVAMFWARVTVSAAGFVALSLAFALAATGFAALLQSLSRSERTGSVIGSILVMIMAMAGGSFVPLEMLPAFVRKIAPFTLTYWGSSGYRDLLFSSAGVARLAPHLAVLGALGAAFSLVAIARFTHRYRTGG